MPPSLPEQGRRDSNPQHAVLETAALPLELLPYCLGNPERVPEPSRALAPASKARLRQRGDGNPERVPEPSRALAPASKARLRQRGDGNPKLPSVRSPTVVSANKPIRCHARRGRTSWRRSRRSGKRRRQSLRLLVLRVLSASAAELRQLEFLRVRALVLRAGVVALATHLTLQGNYHSRGSHGILLVRLTLDAVTQ